MNFKQAYTESIKQLLAQSSDGIVREYGHSVFKGKQALQIHARREYSVLAFNPGAITACNSVWADYIFNCVH
jgi:hypothetical protein